MHYSKKDISKLETVFKSIVTKNGYTILVVKEHSLFYDQLIAYVPDNMFTPTIRFLEIPEETDTKNNNYLIAVTAELITEPHKVLEHSKCKELAYIRIVQPDIKETKKSLELATEHLVQLFKEYNKDKPISDTFKPFCHTF